MPADDAIAPHAAEPAIRGPKARKRTATKASIEPAGKRSLNLRIDDESYKRLSVHALMTNTTISALVEGFAKGLRDYSMPHKLGGTATGQGGQEAS